MKVNRKLMQEHRGSVGLMRGADDYEVGGVGGDRVWDLDPAG